MAMAPDQVGIGIRRHFTRAGEHPYDTVEWETRDARIPNYKSGGDAFFQPGVEFPVTWSQNATNIVAQKYFRGQLGTPEREWSLRQVIDRVADTISDWGVRDGYFTDEAEADAFRDELKYLLLHQRAAFNSPVWFNIGVKGVPAQASACFILAVEDTMSAILNWYVEEGTIFKGGSGSGINLSNIRSSLEPLAGGGTASGPVSFMRGADASAGTIKCLHADTDLVTDHGVVPIRAIAPGWKVLTRHGMKTVLEVHDNGIRPLVKVRTGLGDEILCTPEHKFRVRGAEGEVWREAGRLRPDDYVMVDLAHTDYGVLQRLEAEEPTGAGESPLPVVLDEAFAVWLGWAHGEGRLKPLNGSGALNVHLDGEDKGLVERYRNFTQSVLGHDVNVRPGGSGVTPGMPGGSGVTPRMPGGSGVTPRMVVRGGDAPPATVCPPRVARFLQVNGLWRNGSQTIPRLVRSSPAAVRAAFLAGLFESDGHVQHGIPTLWSKRRTLALEAHRLLLSIGIPSKVTQAVPPAPVRGNGPVPSDPAVHKDDSAGAAPTSGPDGLYRVRIIGEEGVRRFAKFVGFVSEGKARLLEAALRRPSGFEANWFFPHVDNELERIGFGRPALRAAICAYRHDANPYGMSLARAATVQEAFPAELDGALARFAHGDEIYVPVSVETEGDDVTYDLTVEDVHEYLVHNAVTHNSGGKTRRAAKMVILNVDHPDVEQFIWCKAVEERKARALAAAGFDMDLDGSDSHSIQYQNANNSVRVTDEFMEAVVNDRDWALRAVTDGTPLKTVRARKILREISEAAWECADPGMQYDTTINRWHTASNTGRINASNPCFPGSARVHTDKGLVRFEDLVDRVRHGESFGVYTHDATNPDAPAEQMLITTPEAVMITGLNEIVKLEFSNGQELRCTPKHRIFTVNRGYVEARELTPADEVKVLDLPAPAVNADWRIPVPSDLRGYMSKGDRALSMRLPDKWTDEFAHYLGWLVGDGCISGDVVSTVYGGGDDQEAILPRHLELVAWMNGGRVPKPTVLKNGTFQLRQSRRPIARFLEALGIEHSKAAEKKVPWAVEEAPAEIVAAFVRGLFDADGCVYDEENSRYVGLGSSSKELLRGAQRLLSTFGIFSRIYATRKGGQEAFTYTRKDGSQATYISKPMYDLRISNRAIEQFAAFIGFSVPSKHEKLGTLLVNHDFYDMKTAVHLVERTDDGVELTYNLSEPRNHSYVVEGTCVRNCSEYMSLDNSACNLASLNLLKFLNEDGSFDVESFKAAIEVVFTAQEILVGNADYPTQKIAETTRRFRQLGLGYANLGALLMAQGLPYDSDAGRAWAGAITALMTGHAYATSGRTAGRMGPHAGFAENRDPMLKVLRMHRAEVDAIDAVLVPDDLLTAARRAWEEAVELGEVHGVRNSQASVLAPTGTIGLMLDCDTTGIEPDLALTKAKKLVGGGTMFIVNQTVPRALRRLGYSAEQVTQIVAYIDEHKTILGAPGLRVDDLPVFACAMGDNAIHYMGHVKMMAAVQPFISGAISKCVVGETLVSTGDGLVRIGSLYHGEKPDSFRDEVIEVASLDGVRKTDAFYYGGVRPVREVVLRSGHKVIGTPNHRLLVAGKDGLVWRRLDEIEEGESVALRYGAELWSLLPARLDGFEAGEVADAWQVPTEMSAELAFLLGAFAVSGRISESTATVTISHPAQAVLDRLGGAWRSLFGLEARIVSAAGGSGGLPQGGSRCPQVAVTSETAVAFLEFVAGKDGVRGVPGKDGVRGVPGKDGVRGVPGKVEKAAFRRIPAAVLASPRDMVLAYLQGLLASATVARTAGAATVSIGLGSAALLDDLQSVLTNLGVVHRRLDSEVAVSGDSARDLFDLVPPADPQVVARAADVFAGRDLPGSACDFVPNLSPRELYLLVPTEQREEFAFLRDAKFRHVTRATLDAVAALPGVSLPDWVATVVADGLHFSPVERVASAGEREVFDLSVPVTHAFVGNGIVNHNTINMPEEATVEDVEDLHVEAWRMGLKAIAIYRDNCKVGQPLSVQKSASASAPVETKVERPGGEGVSPQVVVETIILQEPVRQKLPRRRNSKTFSFRVADCHGYVIVGEFEDGRPGEIFLKVAKQGSTLAGIMDAFAISVSHGLQYGVPLKAFVDMFTNMRFEPAGITDDPEIRLASSLVDYIFRRLAVEYLTYEERVDMGILTIGERSQPTLPGVEEASTARESSVDLDPPGDELRLDLTDHPRPAAERPSSAAPPRAPGGSGGSPGMTGPPAPAGPRAAAVPEGSRRIDAPYCYGCGMEMQRAGSCYVCSSCGATSGCS